MDKYKEMHPFLDFMTDYNCKNDVKIMLFCVSMCMTRWYMGKKQDYYLDCHFCYEEIFINGSETIQTIYILAIFK